MSSIQFDYSTLSTSISRSELGSVVGGNFMENDAINEEEMGSEKSAENSGETYVQAAPSDRYNLVYLAFGLFGVGALLPWNIFITANDYWMYKFRNTLNGSIIDIHNKTNLQATFTSYLAISYNVPYIICLILCTLFNKRFSKLIRVVGSSVFMFLLFAIVTAFVEIDSDSWQTLFFSLIILLVVAISVASAIFQSGIAGIASLLPSKYMQIMVMGQAMAGIFASVAQSISLLGDHDSVKSALIYFFSADTVILLTLASYVGIQRSAFFKFHAFSLKDTKMLKDVSEPEVKTRISIVIIIKMIWPYAIALLIDLWITIGIFPGLAALAVSESHGKTLWNGLLFLPLACFLLFNISDLCGRAVGGLLPWPSKWRVQFLGFSILRVVFIPLFMLCNLYPRSNLPIIFTSDIYFVIFVTLLAFTNGYVISVSMTVGVKSVNPLLQEMAGIILATFLGAGLMLGSASSYLFVEII